MPKKLPPNPKHNAGLSKSPMRYIPPSAIIEEGRVYEVGGTKYAPFNWGEVGVFASIYHEAIMRHEFDWYTGEDNDPETMVSHLASIRACCGILIDCIHMGNLIDDRPIGKTASAKEVMAWVVAQRKKAPKIRASNGVAGTSAGSQRRKPTRKQPAGRRKRRA